MQEGVERQGGARIDASAMRQEARRLEQHLYGWAVVYGVASQKFWAFAAYPVEQPVMVCGETSVELQERIMRVEALSPKTGQPARLSQLGRARLAEVNLFSGLRGFTAKAKANASV